MKKHLFTSLMMAMGMIIFLSPPLLRAQTTEENADTSTTETDKDVRRMGTIAFDTHYLFVYGASFTYEWPVLPQTTLLVDAAIGAPLIGWGSYYYGADGGSSRTGLFFTKGQVALRWRFDTNYRLRKGYTLRYNSGFYGELALGYMLIVERYYRNHDACRENGKKLCTPDYSHCGTLLLNVGYRYTFKNHIYTDCKAGLGLVAHFEKDFMEMSPLPLLEVKVGYAF